MDMQKYILLESDCNYFVMRSLTPKELEVALLFRRGLSCQKIADKLCIEVTTVYKHSRKLIIKTGAKNGIEASQIAVKHMLELQIQ